MKYLVYTVTLMVTLVVGSFFNGYAGRHPLKAGSDLIGPWRGVFTIRPGVEVPFNFEISGNPADLSISFVNGAEHLKAGRILERADSVFVQLDLFDNELALKKQGDLLVGVLRKQDGSGLPTPIVAQKGQLYRFKVSNVPPAKDFSGTYDISFKSADGEDTKSVGVFTQKGNHLTGTFLRVTGDSRYLEGSVSGQEFQLSGFIGSSPSLFKGTFGKDGSVNGEVVSARGNQPFSGVFNKNAALPDAYHLTFLKEGYKTLDFSFPNVDGKQISLTDKKFKGKVVVLMITGTWCPNCMDEATFFSPWFNKNRGRGVEAIAIHYERKTDPDYVRKALNNYRKKFDITYDQVIAGTPSPEEVAKSLPALKNFLSFPTAIFIDKKGNVAKIHTGYSGPATGKYYDEFVKEFNEEIDTLLAQ
ncbi:Peroxiredoxin [bacterium A37T11]|nr:Peroxiredoxin [bacterium A37T11]